MGVIKVRSNVDRIFYSFVGSGRSRVAKYFWLLFYRESIHILSVYGRLSLEHGLNIKPKCVKKAPNNASSQTKNYEITFLGWRRDHIIRVFSCFFRRMREIHSIRFPFPNLPFLKGINENIFFFSQFFGRETTSSYKKRRNNIGSKYFLGLRLAQSLWTIPGSVH